MAKDFNLEDLGIVSLNELGIDTSNCQINVNDLYQIEYDRCHRKDVDFNSTRDGIPLPPWYGGRTVRSHGTAGRVL